MERAPTIGHLALAADRHLVREPVVDLLVEPATEVGKLAFLVAQVHELSCKLGAVVWETGGHACAFGNE
jgi:hypothetical protein